jgi:hypothetical protein
MCADRREILLAALWGVTGMGAHVRLYQEQYQVAVAGEVSAGLQRSCSAGFAVVAASSGRGWDAREATA